MDLKYSVRSLAYVGDKRAKQLEKLGIFTIWDLLFFLPRRLEDRRVQKNIFDLCEGETVLLKCTLESGPQESRIRPNMTLTKFVFCDGTGKIVATWFNNNYIKRSLMTGGSYYLYGKVEYKYKNWTMNGPVVEDVRDHQRKTAKIVPIYPLTANLSQTVLSTLIENAMKLCIEYVEEPIPREILHKYAIPDIKKCLNDIHFPPSFEAFEAARRRFALEELLIIRLGLSMLRMKNVEKKGININATKSADVSPFLESLSFKLTDGQKAAVLDIISDFRQGKTVSRLIQGDVGCGKTVVAAMVMYMVAKSGYQAVLLAPTEILATQHFENISRMIPDFKTVLLLGGPMTKAKKAVIKEIENGEAQIVVATHAVLQEYVNFRDLALVVTDEQHRFGVKQRSALVEKGRGIHTLIMTATPIPRTLALMIYGDLDISVIKDLPKGRQPISTHIVKSANKKQIYDFVLHELNKGHQCFVVVPLVEKGEDSQLKSAVEYRDELESGLLEGKKVACLHGKMRPKEKDEIMQKFVSHEYDVLVATVVIEVGIDVPNATVIVIEGAQRFGLSQLHQLRGRVGRGDQQSYCILVNDGEGEIAKERMNTLKNTTDGFVIADKDLELRGTGEFFGVKQHGLPEFKVANMASDGEIIALSAKIAQEILEEDAQLTLPKNRLFAEKLKELNIVY